VSDRAESAAELTPDEERALAGVWLARTMFGWLVDPALKPFYTETRTFEQFLADHASAAPEPSTATPYTRITDAGPDLTSRADPA
jgi:hypothetical protein